MDSRVISGFWLPWRAGGGSPENKVREQVCDNACRQTPLPEVKQDQDEKGWGFQQHSVESPNRSVAEHLDDIRDSRAEQCGPRDLAQPFQRIAPISDFFRGSVGDC